MPLLVLASTPISSALCCGPRGLRSSAQGPSRLHLSTWRAVQCSASAPKKATAEGAQAAAPAAAAGDDAPKKKRGRPSKARAPKAAKGEHLQQAGREGGCCKHRSSRWGLMAWPAGAARRLRPPHPGPFACPGPQAATSASPAQLKDAFLAVRSLCAAAEAEAAATPAATLPETPAPTAEPEAAPAATQAEAPAAAAEPEAPTLAAKPKPPAPVEAPPPPASEEAPAAPAPPAAAPPPKNPSGEVVLEANGGRITISRTEYLERS